MTSLVARTMQRPAVAHLMRAVERYLTRLGAQFAGGITYFSVLALVPILMLAFATLGFVLTVLRPDLIEVVVQTVAASLGTNDATNASLVELIQNWLRNWAAVGVTALLIAVYSGAGWMDNLKIGVRAQWRPQPNLQPAQGNIVIQILVNLLTLVGLLVAIVVTFALAAVSTSLADTVVNLLGLEAIGWLTPVLRLVPIVFSVGAGWVLFLYLYRVLPETRAPWPVLWRGALMGAVGLAILQYLTGILFSVFSRNAAAALFGPVITLMLFFNLFAQLILFVAAWIATAQVGPPTEAEATEGVRFALRPPDQPAEVEVATVPKQVAVRSVQAGIGAGYLTGAATGVGLGALLAAAAARLARRRDDD